MSYVVKAQLREAGGSGGACGADVAVMTVVLVVASAMVVMVMVVVGDGDGADGNNVVTFNNGGVDGGVGDDSAECGGGGW